MTDVTGQGRQRSPRWAGLLRLLSADVPAPRTDAGEYPAPRGDLWTSIGDAVRAAHAAGVPF